MSRKAQPPTFRRRADSPRGESPEPETPPENPDVIPQDTPTGPEVEMPEGPTAAAKPNTYSHLKKYRLISKVKL